MAFGQGIEPCWPPHTIMPKKRPPSLHKNPAPIEMVWAGNEGTSGLYVVLGTGSSVRVYPERIATSQRGSQTGSSHLYSVPIATSGMVFHCCGCGITPPVERWTSRSRFDFHPTYSTSSSNFHSRSLVRT